MDLSILIPTYNEDCRLGATLCAAKRYIETQKLSVEIVVSDDCSTDGTLILAQSLLAGLPHQLLYSTMHRGKGDVIRRGIIAAKGESILFADADLCTPFESFDRLSPWLNKGYDIVIGTRHHVEAHIVVPQPQFRAALGYAYLSLANLLLNTSFSDINCGFKLFNGRVARRLFPLSKQNDWTFDAEILYLARLCGYCIKEVPVAWIHRPGSRVNPLKDACSSIVGLLHIWLRTLCGAYDLTSDFDQSFYN